MEYSWETLDFARWQKKSENLLSEDHVFLAFLQAVAITYRN